MTVKELINELRKYPENQRVLLSEYDGYNDIQLMQPITAVEDIGGEDEYEYVPFRYQQAEKCHTPKGDVFEAVVIVGWV